MVPQIIRFLIVNLKAGAVLVLILVVGASKLLILIV